MSGNPINSAQVKLYETTMFTGDIFQIERPYLDSLSNGLSNLIEKMQGNPLYAHTTMQKGERSKLTELASDLL